MKRWPAWRHLLLAMTLSLFFSQVFAEAIDEVVIEGNLKTRSGIIQQEMLLRAGDEFSTEKMQESRQNILDLGLFSEVELSKKSVDGRTILQVRIKEKKHDWFILPRLDRNVEGDITLGLNWRANNLGGRNIKARLSLSHKNYDSAIKDKEYRIGGRLRYPRIMNTRFSAYGYASGTEVNLDEERNGIVGSYDRRVYNAGIGMGRWFSESGVSKGLHMSLGLDLSRYQHDYLSGEPGYYDDASFTSLLGSISYTDVKDFEYSRSGRATGLRLQTAQEALGSDRPYFYQYAFYRAYKLLPFRAHTNFNYQVQIGNGDHSLFGGPVFRLGGDQTLRGYAREELEGDAYFLVNTEFLTPIFGQRALRAGALFDFGNAYESLSELKNLDFEYSMGLSFRWVLKQWVNTELRIDYAKGLGERGDSRFYVGTSSTF